MVKLIDNWEAQYGYVTNEGTRFWFKTNLNAPKNKLITIDLANSTEVRLHPPPLPLCAHRQSSCSKS
jgi:hypothetical protein